MEIQEGNTPVMNSSSQISASGDCSTQPSSKHHTKANSITAIEETKENMIKMVPIRPTPG